mmetsp:Transcript_20735/g.59218  ORF Transcript_20735/g.59218 Transcript_20735/m.59218 type:complete len:233 (-) Transcript_20735:134-832(-)
MATALPAPSALYTSTNIRLWSTRGWILYSDHSPVGGGAASCSVSFSSERTDSTCAVTPRHATASFGLSCSVKRVPRPSSVRPSSGESHTRPVPLKARSWPRSTGMDCSSRASAPTKRLRIELAAVRKDTSERPTPHMTTNGSRNWLACGAHTKMTGVPSSGTLNWFRATNSRKKTSRMPNIRLTNICFPEILMHTKVITKNALRPRARSGGTAIGGRQATTAKAVQSNQMWR